MARTKSDFLVSALTHIDRLLGKCTPENQPSPDVLGTLVRLIALQRSPDASTVEGLYERIGTLENQVRHLSPPRTNRGTKGPMVSTVEDLRKIARSG